MFFSLMDLSLSIIYLVSLVKLLTAALAFWCFLLDSDDETNVKPQSNPEKAQELAIMLQENAQHIHSILKRELAENPSPDRPRADLPRPNSAEVEFVRRQADELIKTFGGLVSNLNQFCDLIKDGGYDGIISMN